MLICINTRNEWKIGGMKRTKKTAKDNFLKWRNILLKYSDQKLIVALAGCIWKMVISALRRWHAAVMQYFFHLIINELMTSYHLFTWTHSKLPNFFGTKIPYDTYSSISMFKIILHQKFQGNFKIYDISFIYEKSE